MPDFKAALLFILTLKLCNGSQENTLTQAPIAYKQIETKDEYIVKLVPQKERLDYPGNNLENLKKIDENWKKYYNCLSEKSEKEKERKLVAVQIMEGQHTSFKCPHCPKPFQETANLEWRYKPLDAGAGGPEEPEFLDLAPQMRISHKMSLKIYNALTGYSGLYACYYGTNPISVYILEVVKDQNPQLLDELPSSNYTTQLPDGTLLEVYYIWSKWTECSACDTVGKRYKYGTCMAKLKNPIEPGERVSQQAGFRDNDFFISEYLTKKKLQRKIRKHSKKRQNSVASSQASTNEMELNKNIFNKFQTGIPCASPLLPKLSRPLIENLNVSPAALIVEFCKIKCAESTLFEVVDPQGKIIEIANNTAGIYSSMQDIPRTPPEIERTTVTAQYKTDVIIRCPGNLDNDTPITWMIDSYPLIPELISVESKGRIHVDFFNRVHINRVRLRDVHIYRKMLLQIVINEKSSIGQLSNIISSHDTQSEKLKEKKNQVHMTYRLRHVCNCCWQKNKLVGAVSLNVSKEPELEFDHHTMLFSLLILGLAFLYVIIMILKREIQMRKK